MPKMKRKPRKPAKTKEQLALEKELQEALEEGMPVGMADMLAALQGIPPDETNEPKENQDDRREVQGNA